MSSITTTGWTAVGPAPVGSTGPGQGGNAGRANVAVADPTNATTIYLGAAGGGIWKTINAAAGGVPTWEPVTDDQLSLQVGGVHALALCPSNHAIVQAAVCHSGGGILRSGQSGVPGSWSLGGNIVFDGHVVNGIGVHPTNTSVTFAATDMGLFQSTNANLTWTLVAGSLPAMSIADVIFARSNANTLFATVCSGSGSSANLNGVYRSVNGGVTWALLTNLPNSALSGQFTNSSGLNTVNGAIQIDSGSGGIVYVSMLIVGNDPSNPGGLAIIAVQRYKTLDNGDIWTEISASPGGLETRSWHQLIAVDPKNDQHVIVNDSYSLSESDDSGATWTMVTGAGTGFDWAGVSFDSNGAVLAAADQGLFRYTPASKVWESLIGNLQITTLYTVSVNSQLIGGIAQDQYGGMMNTNNDQSGAAWQYLQGGGETGKILLPPFSTDFAYVFNPLSNNNYDLVWRDKVSPAAGMQPGDTWSPIFSKNIIGAQNYNAAYTCQKAFVMDPANAKRLLVGLDQVYETTNADAMPPSPAPIWNPIGPAPGNNVYVTAIAIAPSATNTIYVATSDQHVWLTTNNGGTWAACDNGLFGAAGGAVQAICIDPADDGHVFAVSGQWWGSSKVWELPPATAAGQPAWINRSGPTNLGVYALVVDWQYKAPCLFIGTDRGVYTSANLGGAWSYFGTTPDSGQSMPKVQVYDLQSSAVSATESLVAAGTYGRGVFEIQIAPSSISGACTILSDLITGPVLRGLQGVAIALEMSSVPQGSLFGDGSLSTFTTTTDLNGNYRFQDVPPGVYSVNATPPEALLTLSRSRTVYVNGSALGNVDFGYINPVHVNLLSQFRGRSLTGRPTPVMQPPWGQQ